MRNCTVLRGFIPAARSSWWQWPAESQRRVTALRVLRALFLVGILSYLGYKLTEIGWEPVWEERPTHPLFYLFFLLLYFLLPLTEMLIYRITWPYDVRRGFPAFLKKRIYNREVLAYAGEVYFVAWASKNVDLPRKELLKTIRDTNIVSSAASTMIALVLLGVFLYVDHLSMTDLIGDHSLSDFVGGGLLGVVLVLLGLRFRKYLFSMAAQTALLIFAIQGLRLVLGQALQIAQWSVMMPAVPLSVWFTFAAISIILTRIPFILNHNLVFMGVGVELSSSLGIPEAAMFSMLAVLVVLDKLMNFSLLALIALPVRKQRAPSLEAAKPTSDRVTH